MSSTQQARAAAWPEAPAPVRVVARRDGSLLLLFLHGEADASTCDFLRATLAAALQGNPQAVRVDAGGLEFCDLSTSDALHDFVDAAAARDIPVELRGMSPLLAMMYTCFAPLRSLGAAQRLVPDAMGSCWDDPSDLLA